MFHVAIEELSFDNYLFCWSMQGGGDLNETYEEEEEGEEEEEELDEDDDDDEPVCLGVCYDSVFLVNYHFWSILDNFQQFIIWVSIIIVLPFRLFFHTYQLFPISLPIPTGGGGSQ